MITFSPLGFLGFHSCFAIRVTGHAFLVWFRGGEMTPKRVFAENAYSMSISPLSSTHLYLSQIWLNIIHIKYTCDIDPMSKPSVTAWGKYIWVGGGQSVSDEYKWCGPPHDLVPTADNHRPTRPTPSASLSEPICSHSQVRPMIYPREKELLQ